MLELELKHLHAATATYTAKAADLAEIAQSQQDDPHQLEEDQQTLDEAVTHIIKQVHNVADR